MMKDKILSILDKIIIYSFYILFFWVPLILTPFNYELFEYNKMMLVYGMTVIIVASWLGKIILKKELNIPRTPLDLPLILFLLSQIISTIFSLDRHVSWFGYYSRFNGGLLSTISYFLLYYAFVSNFPKEKIKSLLFLALSSGFFVSLYGILEHFGIDKNIWVQDVQNRVFSTLGQPNWLAAYLAVLIPVSLGLGITALNSDEDHLGKVQSAKFKVQSYNSKLKNSSLIVSLLNCFITVIFYLTLLYTKSRSGFVGFWIADIILITFLIIISLINKQNTFTVFSPIGKKTVKDRFSLIKSIVLINIFLAVITFLIGSPFVEINRFTLPQLLKKETAVTEVKAPSGTALETGGTESGEIRKIVWSGAVDIIRHYPVFGTGVETFAFAYYKFRPAAHNLVSEWDFLYNKAHNEYLNYGATTGLAGLGSYLLVIFVFIAWNLQKIKDQSSKIKATAQNSKLFSDHNSLFPARNASHSVAGGIIHYSLFVAWLSILVTNFFGFSVVVTQLFLYLLPGMVFLLSGDPVWLKVRFGEIKKEPWGIKSTVTAPLDKRQSALMILVILAALYLLGKIAIFWYADTVFNRGYNLNRVGEVGQANHDLSAAVKLNPEEPFYHDELSVNLAQLSLLSYEQRQATLSASLAQSAIDENTTALRISPQNVTFWKSRTRIYFALSNMDEKYLAQAIESLLVARNLSPTDPKIIYNLGLLYIKKGERDQGLKFFQEAINLKKNYRDPYFARALVYLEVGKKDQAKADLEYILTKIDPQDSEAKKQLSALTK